MLGRYWIKLYVNILKLRLISKCENNIYECSGRYWIHLYVKTFKLRLDGKCAHVDCIAMVVYRHNYMHDFPGDVLKPTPNFDRLRHKQLPGTDVIMKWYEIILYFLGQIYPMGDFLSALSYKKSLFFLFSKVYWSYWIFENAGTSYLFHGHVITGMIK